jgi:GxxExxY protein
LKGEKNGGWQHGDTEATEEPGQKLGGQASSMTMLILQDLSEKIIGAAIEVHRALGPGLLESAYEQCLCHELSVRGMQFGRQLSLPLVYKGVKLDCGYCIDLLVEDAVIIELKSVEKVLPVHLAQLLTYMRLSNKKLGLLINFNERLLKDGLHRIVR